MDTVPADPEQWERDPFTMERAGDIVYGRGTTDCLGHVAMLTLVFEQLALKKPELNIGVTAVFIANEENSDIGGIGIDEMEKRGELAFLKNGPLIWVDSADIGPTLGTGGVITWSLTAKGKLFHSGLPHKAINSIDLVYEACKVITSRFHEDFPYGDKEKAYLFQVGSSMKATQMKCAPGGLNQIPGWATLEGDIRLTPFHDMKDMMAKVQSCMIFLYIFNFIFDVNDIDVSTLPSVGNSKYFLPQENLKVYIFNFLLFSIFQGTLELKFNGEPSPGVAVNMESVGYIALRDAITAVRGVAKPFSLTGSLPIIADLQKQGYDVQVVGFGLMAAYHANNEVFKFCLFII